MCRTVTFGHPMPLIVSVRQSFAVVLGLEGHAGEAFHAAMQTGALQPPIEELLHEPATGADVFATAIGPLLPALKGVGDRYPRLRMTLCLFLDELTDGIFFIKILIGCVDDPLCQASCRLENLIFRF